MLHEAGARALLAGLQAAELRELDDDDDGQEIVQAWLDAVRETHARIGGELLVEQRFHLASLSPWLWGTADAVVYAPPHLAVLDLKTGGHLVELQRDGVPNLQLAGYALGVLDTLPADAGAIRTVELAIVQPRLGGVSSMVIDALQLYELAVDLVDGIEAAEAPNAPLEPGAHCRYCRAAATCLAHRALVEETTRMSFEVVDTTPPPPAELTLEELAQVLDRAEQVDIWIGAIRQRALHEAQRGRCPPGYKLVSRRGRRRWVEGKEDQVELCLELAGLEEGVYTAPKLRSPAQVEAALRKAKRVLSPEAWEGLVERSDPGAALVRDTDPRPTLSSGMGFDIVHDT